MEETNVAVRELTVELPESAPLVRVTAGFGSAGQKTWNLRRPITLIGSRRPAHIVLHDKDISAAHCVIVNTGSEVLLKDLHTSGGTYCNKERSDLVVLKDGDTIAIGGTQIQIAIQRSSDSNPDDSGCGMHYVDPTKFPTGLRLQLIHTDRSWNIEQAVALIGRHGGALVHLDHADLAARHAIIFRFQRQAAIFDLGGRTGIWVNGQRTSLTPLGDGDRISVGPFGLCVQYGSAAAVEAVLRAAATNCAETSQVCKQPLDASDPTGGLLLQSGVFAACDPPLEGAIAKSWDSLNSWESRLKADASAMGERQHNLSVREAAQDARDAELRGKLHDIERFNEQVAAREKEVAALASTMQVKLDEIGGKLKTAVEREADLDRRAEELLRREHALTQRWSRLQSTTCGKCGEKMNVGAMASPTG